MPNTIWKPHPRQEEALKRIEFEILYGGARGGGKTDAGLVWLTDHIDNPRYRALVIRKNADDLSDWVDRAARMYSLLGVKIAYRPAEITFPSGATIKTGHLKDDQAYTKYQGHEYQRMLIEELTQVPDEKRYLQLLASCRSTVSGILPQVFNTTNPGGVGHGWVKRRFVDVAPSNTPYTDPISKRSRIYIPARIDDNPTLLQADPNYINFLESLKDTDVELWKAWRLGDWDTFAGQFFKEFRRDLHVVKPYKVVKTADNVIIGGMDWGRTAPFAFGLTEVTVRNLDGVKFYRARTFFEVYGTDKTPRQWAEIIKEKLKDRELKLDDIVWIRGDPAMFTKGQDNSISIADQFKENLISIKPASNDRVGGWENLHNWLSIAPDGLPYWQITEDCINLIKELPELVHDENKVEDVDTESMDHISDASRYAFKHLKWIDAKLGGVRYKQQGAIERRSPIYHQGQIGVDPAKFANVDRKKSRIGGIK